MACLVEYLFSFKGSQTENRHVLHLFDTYLSYLNMIAESSESAQNGRDPQSCSVIRSQTQKTRGNTNIWHLDYPSTN